jgi:hypothetical protein
VAEVSRVDRLLSLGAALVGAAILIIVYPSTPAPPPTPPVAASVAWPHASTATVKASLPDGSAYQPGFFLTANDSVGTSTGQTSSRLVLVGPGNSVRQLRSVPLIDGPWFGSFASSGDVLAWAEGRNDPVQLWTVNLRDGRPARELTGDTGQAILNGTPHDLLIAHDRLYWTAAVAEPNVTEIRSVALTGGPVQVRTESGTWDLSTWPWLVNGRGDPTGATQLRNMITGRDVAVSRNSRQATHCDPTWCVVVALSGDGYQIDITHPDGTGRLAVASGQVSPAIDDQVALGRFVVMSQVAPYSDLTGTRQLLVFDLATRRTVEVSPAARTVSYSDGVLWWSTGTQDAPVWHTLALPTS